MRPITANSTIWETTAPMDNKHTIEKNDLNTNNAYKHSLSDCSIKLNGIKALLSTISDNCDDTEIKSIAESAQAMCNELIREIT